MERVRLGVIGVGSVVREIYQYLYFKSGYSDSIDVVAACDPDGEQLRWFAELAGLQANRCFQSYEDMIAHCPLDVVAINTPDSLHRDPAVFPMEHGLDVLLPKPLASTVEDAHAILDASRRTGRIVAVDFHKRSDPLTIEARSRFAAGAYGRLQSAVWYMVDQLQVADPNHEPRFFASPSFAEENSPVSFLTVHMADTFFHITGDAPKRVRATGFKQKLPSLSPIAVDGYDLVDTEILTARGCLCRIISGWAIPNTAHALTVQSARLIGSDGVLDLALDSLGYHEITHEALRSRNTSFRTFGDRVGGFGIVNPGDLLARIAAAGEDASARAATRNSVSSPAGAGFWATAVCAAAHESLDRGEVVADCVVDGEFVDVDGFLSERLGAEAEAYMSPAEPDRPGP
jgi:predicted dehydrogenase